MLSPPRAKKSSSTPTARKPSTSANSRAQHLPRAACAAAAALRRRRSRAPAARAGRACRSASAAAVQHHERRRHHVVGQLRREMPRAAPSASSAAVAGRGHDVGDEPLAAAAPGPSLARDDHRRLRARAAVRRSSAASISPGSIRKPRIFTWRRPGRGTPARRRALQRARSPVRYIRRPGAERVGHEPLRGQARRGPGSRGPGRRRPGTARRRPQPAPGASASSST